MKKKTDTELLSKIILNCLGTDEFFINKAIGWALREYSKTAPAWVKSFIERNKSALSSLSLKEASKYI
ncbi:DNA alkylation repair protein [Ruminococcus flavefaciens]|uniref:DNA alkylation repair protein n=1 Tax=Ruminococcus flavefaciens TaxID=1265 RepID=UPI00325A9281